MRRGKGPERGQSGAFLKQSSTSGTKLDAKINTKTSSGPFTIASGTGTSILFTTRLYNTDNEIDQNTETLLQPEEVISWRYVDIFVDNDEVGASLIQCEADKDIFYCAFEILNVDEGATQQILYVVFNAGSSRDVYIRSQNKAIVTVLE